MNITKVMQFQEAVEKTHVEIMKYAVKWARTGNEYHREAALDLTLVLFYFEIRVVETNRDLVRYKHDEYDAMLM